MDDHPLVRHGFCDVLAAEPDLEVCGQAATVRDALEAVESCAPDLVLVDISLEGSASGLELVKELRARRPALRALVSSVHDESLFAERALRAGARGYVHKRQPVEEVVRAIRQVLAGKVYLSPPMTERLLAAIGDGQAAVAPEARLSDRELEVYGLLGRGLTTRAIAQRLGLSVKTIETHRENVKRKLGIENNNELIRRAVEWALRQS